MSSGPTRVVSTSMLGMTLKDIDQWSPAVSVVLGQNPGPFTGPGTNTFLIGTGRHRILLDTGQGVDAYLDLLARGLSETPGAEGIQEILVTHAHPDHIGGVEGVVQRFGEMRVSKKPWPELDRDIEVRSIDDGSEVATQGATLTAMWTPGHARDHLCFYLREEKAVFTGDNVLGAGTTVIPRDGDLAAYLASLERLLELDMEVIYPAHGPAIRRPRAKVEEYIAHRALRDEQIFEGLTAGVSTIEGLVERIYVDVPEFLHAAAGMSVEAHLRRFANDGVVVRDGSRWYLTGRS